MRALAQVEATAAAQAQVDEQVKKTLGAEKSAQMEKLTDAIMRERMRTEDQRLMVQLYVSMHVIYVQYCAKGLVNKSNV